MHRSLVVLAALLLASCATHSPEADAQAQAQAQLEATSKDAVKCQSYGLQPGNPEYEKCLTQLADKRAQAEIERARGSRQSPSGPPADLGAMINS